MNKSCPFCGSEKILAHRDDCFITLRVNIALNKKVPTGEELRKAFNKRNKSKNLL